MFVNVKGYGLVHSTFKSESLKFSEFSLNLRAYH